MTWQSSSVSSYSSERGMRPQAIADRGFHFEESHRGERDKPRPLQRQARRPAGIQEGRQRHHASVGRAEFKNLAQPGGNAAGDKGIRSAPEIDPRLRFLRDLIDQIAEIRKLHSRKHSSPIGFVAA